MSDEGEAHFGAAQIAAQTGIAAPAVTAALRKLSAEQPPYFSFREFGNPGAGPLAIGMISEPTGHAQRAVGAWPAPHDSGGGPRRGPELNCRSRAEREEARPLSAHRRSYG